MINEIKTIVQNYLNNIKLTSLLTGTVVNDGIKVSDRLIIPYELIKGNLKEFVSPDDKVRLIRNHGGQEFYILEILNRPSVSKGMTITLNKDGISYDYKIEDVKL